MALYGAIGEAPAVRGGSRKGASMVSGFVALDGANPTPITTPFREVTAVSLTLAGAVAPGLTASVLTYDVVDNVVNVYAWMPTSATNPTLIASTDTDNVSYMIIGVY